MTIKDIKTAFDKGDYEEVISLTSKSDEPSILLFRISSFINLKKEKEALNCLLDNRQSLFYFSPLKTIECNISLRCYLREFDEAYDDIEYYRNEKYISQEVEEVIASLKDRIREEEKNDALHDDPDDIDELVLKIKRAKDDDTILFYLTKMAKFKDDLRDCSRVFINILKEKHSSTVKSFALILLKMAGYEKEVTFEKRGKKYALIPIYLTLPFMDDGIKEEISLIRSLTKDSTIGKVACQLFNQYTLEIYPDPWLEEAGDETLYATAFLALAMDYLHIPNGNIAIENDVRPIDLEATKKAIQTVFDLRDCGLL